MIFLFDNLAIFFFFSESNGEYDLVVSVVG